MMSEYLKQKISGIIENFVMPLIIIIHRFLKPKHHREVPIIYYHSIDDKDLSIPINIFREQMSYLHKKGFKTISLDELIDFIEFGGKISSKAIIITFDDCFRSVYNNALPVLREFGFKATFFVTVSYVGKRRWGSIKHRCWSDEKSNDFNIPFDYMTWDQLRHLVNLGMEIEAHTVTHRNLIEFSREEWEDETVDSKKILEDRLGISVDTFFLLSSRKT